MLWRNHIILSHIHQWLLCFFENHKTSGHHKTSIVFFFLPSVLSVPLCYCSCFLLLMTYILAFNSGLTFHPTHFITFFLFLIPLLNPSSLWHVPSSQCAVCADDEVTLRGSLFLCLTFVLIKNVVSRGTLSRHGYGILSASKWNGVVVCGFATQSISCLCCICSFL